MKRIIRLTESDLTRIVRRVLKEEGTSKTLTPAQIETIPVGSLHTVIHDAISPVIGNDREADVTAALYNITKREDPCCDFQRVFDNYKKTYGSNMWEDISDELNPYKAYHKISMETAKFFFVNACHGFRDSIDRTKTITVGIQKTTEEPSPCFTRVTKMFPDYKIEERVRR